MLINACSCSVVMTSSGSDYSWTNLKVIQECITSKPVIFVTVRVQRMHSSRLAGSCFLSAKVIFYSLCWKKKLGKNFILCIELNFPQLTLVSRTLANWSSWGKQVKVEINGLVLKFKISYRLLIINKVKLMIIIRLHVIARNRI